MIYRRSIELLLFCALGQALGQAAEPLPLPESTPWDIAALKKAPKFEWIRQEGDVQALLYAGEKYRGKPTRVFAFYASPRTLGQAVKGKVPGIVLVHGGGGTAFANWAQLWAKRGYAAIAPCLWGDQPGLRPPPLLRNDTRITAVKVFNNTYRNLGQMAQWTGLAVYDGDPY